MSLRYPVNIRRRAPGAYVAGNWVPGGVTTIESIMATVQPATLSDYDMLQPLLEGRRVEGVVRVYTDAELTLAGEVPGATGDELEWPEGLRTRGYVFMARSPWQSTRLAHYRYLAAHIPEVQA